TEERRRVFWLVVRRGDRRVQLERHREVLQMPDVAHQRVGLLESGPRVGETIHFDQTAGEVAEQAADQLRFVELPRERRGLLEQRVRVVVAAGEEVDVRQVLAAGH